MGDQDRFQEWFRELAEQIGRSVERLSEVDVDELAERYKVDAERAREFADAAGQWLAGSLGRFDPPAAHTERPAPASAPADVSGSAGPHPLDVPSPQQGLALSALDSGRWTVRAGSNQLAGTGVGAAPPADAPDLVSDLRARDWIASDGTVTLVGRHALARWCRLADEPEPPAPQTERPAP
jgi:hypothetical protein